MVPWFPSPLARGASMTEHPLDRLLRQRILILDGAMGTMIQRYKLDEAAYRGKKFASHPVDIKGNNELLVLTRPDVIEEIHAAYLAAGADIIETNTFNANRLNQAEYKLQDQAYALNVAGGESPVKPPTPSRKRRRRSPVLLPGPLAPRTAPRRFRRMSTIPVTARSISTNWSKFIPNRREGLIDGGIDLFLVETIFDTLNAKAAIFAVNSLCEKMGKNIPLIISGTITDASGRTLSGQTTEAFWISVAHAQPLAAGLNCALGAKDMRPYIAELSRVAPCYIICYPNAGLPNAFAEYDQTPEEMAALIEEFAQSGFVNIVGGCCGTTPEHIRAIAQAVAKIAPRPIPRVPVLSSFSGLEPLVIRPESNFINIGERTNVTGSKKFARLILEGNYEEALSIARQQVEAGAQMIDVNMDEAMLDSEKAMVKFLNLIASEPEISRVPVMIDSSKWPVIEAGLKCVQGKSVVNSLSLKEGEAVFRIRRARSNATAPPRL